MHAYLHAHTHMYAYLHAHTHVHHLQIVAFPYLHETISSVIDTVYNEKKVCELDIEALKQASK